MGSCNQFTLDWPKPGRHKWMVDLARTVETDVFFDFNDRNNKLIKVWVYQKELYMRWCAKVDFFSQYLQAGSDLRPFQLPAWLGFKNDD
jgi:hypothetical protein